MSKYILYRSLEELKIIFNNQNYNETRIFLPTFLNTEHSKITFQLSMVEGRYFLLQIIL